MPQHTQLQTADGHKLDAYIAQPTGEPRAGIVVVQEIYGVNAHIRSVADGFARAGYLTIAPALFDRAQRDAELPYTSEGSKKGMALAHRIPPDQTMEDIASAIEYLREHGTRKVGVVGYCWGGALAWMSNTRLHPDATVSYYPGGIQNTIHEKPTCPAIFHFGLLDAHISPPVVEQVRQAHPNLSVFTYVGAGHAFNNDMRPSYNPEAAKLAQQRTLAHLDRYLVDKIDKSH
jgi:carboxymethylenebutenolidase